MKFLVINGPNLNFLGSREPQIYGKSTYQEIVDYTDAKLKSSTFSPQPLLTWFQSQSESAIIEQIHETIHGPYDGLIINPAAYSHYSVAITDALKMVTVPTVEVHLTNVFQREDFRKTLLTAQSVPMIILGCGMETYFILQRVRSIIN